MLRPRTIALLLLALLLLGLAPQASAQPRTITVAPDGPVPTLTAAIGQARPGDRIAVQPGVYREPTIRVDKPLTIEGTGFPVLDGEGDRTILHVLADSVTIRGLHFRDVGTSFMEDRAAVKVDKATGCVIDGNRLEDTFFGIFLAKATRCRVTNNELRAQATSESFSGNGIHLWYSTDVTITGNTVQGHRDGIYFEFVEDSHVEDNLSEGNLRYGLHFMYSDHCRYEGNTFRDNGAGVAVMFTRHVVMRDNRFEHNWGSAAYGLLLKDIYDSEIVGNVFLKNTIGIYSENSSRVAVRRNVFRSNGWGVKIMANSIDNRFSENNFIGNTFDVTTNSRQNHSSFDGNYWDEYQGYDLDRDGVGDVPFRPVRLFAFMVEQNEPAVLLLRSLFVTLLDAAERVLPSITPETLVDAHPAMHRFPLSR